MGAPEPSVSRISNEAEWPPSFNVDHFKVAAVLPFAPAGIYRLLVRTIDSGKIFNREFLAFERLPAVSRESPSGSIEPWLSN